METTPTPLLLLFRAAALLALLPMLAHGQPNQTMPDNSPDKASEEVVQLDAFNVSTSLGTYHEETSSMATKIPTDLKELSSSLQILNANAIFDRNAVLLQDVFNYVVGVNQSQGNINGFSFRGFPNTGTYTQNIQFDGLLGATLKKGASSAADVESIEFLKGPNSVLYGQMHPGGLLNVVSKSPQPEQDLELRTTFITFAGAFNDFGNKNGVTGSIDATGPIDAGKHLLYRLVVDAESNPSSRPGDYDRLFSIFPSLTYRWNAQTALTVKLEASQDHRRQDDTLLPIFTGTPVLAANGLVTAAYGEKGTYTLAPFNTVYQEPTDSARDRGEALSTHFSTVVDDLWTFRAQTRSVWHNDYAHELTQNAATVFFPATTKYATLNSTIDRQYNLVINGHRYNFFDANLYGKIGPNGFLNTIMIGVGGGEEFYDGLHYGFGPLTTPGVTLYNPILGRTPYPPDGTGIQSAQVTLTNFGEYLSDQIKIGDRVHLSGGVRNDQQVSHGIDVDNPLTSPYVHQIVKSVTGQAGAVFDLSKQTSVYASWSQSVVPNIVTSIDATGHSGFAPEKGLQYETGLKFENSDRTLYASVAAYYIERTNVLVSSGQTLPVTGQAIFRVDGAQHSEGVEFETEWQPKPYWQIQAGTALGKAFVAASVKAPYTVGDDLVNAPRASANFFSRYNIPQGPLKGVGISAGVIYVGKQWAGDPTTVTYFSVSGWTRMDSALYYKWRRYQFALNIQNLFDRRYIAYAQSAEELAPGEQRKLVLSVDVHF